MIDLSTIPIREQRSVHEVLRGLLCKNPEMTGIASVCRALEAGFTSTASYKKGEEFLKVANEHGLDAGHAEASDYYFAVLLEDLVDRQNKPVGVKHVHLITCFKFQWWKNGESYRQEQDGEWCRGFLSFVGEPFADRWDENGSFGSTQEDADKLRAALLKSGMEEKLELIPLYEEACNADREQRADLRADLSG